MGQSISSFSTQQTESNDPPSATDEGQLEDVPLNDSKPADESVKPEKKKRRPKPPVEQPPPKDLT